MKDRIKPASQGEPSLLVLTIPPNLSLIGESVEVYALCLEFREGGLLLALPHDSLSQQVLDEGQLGAEESVFGPNSLFTAGLLEETETGESVVIGADAEVLVVDARDEVIDLMREYDPVTDSLVTILGYDSEHLRACQTQFIC